MIPSVLRSLNIISAPLPRIHTHSNDDMLLAGDPPYWARDRNRDASIDSLIRIPKIFFATAFCLEPDSENCKYRNPTRIPREFGPVLDELLQLKVQMRAPEAGFLDLDSDGQADCITDRNFSVTIFRAAGYGSPPPIDQVRGIADGQRLKTSRAMQLEGRIRQESLRLSGNDS